MITDIKGKVESLSPASAGAQDNLRMTRLGQLLTADWKTNLLLAGKLWRVSAGTITVNIAVQGITGGGDGTFIELEQPEIMVGVPVGYYLIPVEIDVGAVISLIKIVDDSATIMAMVDRDANVQTATSTSTTETPDNLLDGGAAFPGNAYSAVTADLTTPVPTVSEILIHRNTRATATVVAPHNFSMRYEPAVPDILKGPCAVYVYWGGVVAMSAIGSIVVGCVPASWVE